MSPLVGVIPAAGRGTRAYPYTDGIPKCMLEVDGQPNLARLIALLRDQMGVKDVVVITGRYGEVIERHFGDGTAHGVNLIYVPNDAIDRGLSHSILLARPHVGDRFVVLLGDECYLDSNHRALADLDQGDALAVVGVIPDGDPELVTRNYGVVVRDGMARGLVEKPRDPQGTCLGVGTFLFRKEIFGHLEAALAAGPSPPNDPVSVLGRLCAAGERIRVFPVTGGYVNINDRDALNLANALIRSNRFDKRSVGLAVLHRGSLELSLRTAAAYRALQRLDRVVVILPPGIDPAQAGDQEACVAPSDEPGDLLRAGLDALGTDILLTTYGDAQYAPRDVPKLLEYLKDADVVLGTRTTRQLVDQGTNMRGIVRLAHVCLAKAVELVWWAYEPRLTDVGCAFRGMWASTYRLIRPRLSQRGPEAFLEMVLETLACRRRVIEIPVSFHVRRRGLREREQTVRTVLGILSFIVRRRLGWP